MLTFISEGFQFPAEQLAGLSVPGKGVIQSLRWTDVHRGHIWLASCLQPP